MVSGSQGGIEKSNAAYMEAPGALPLSSRSNPTR